MATFVVAQNPDAASRLPYVLRLPVAGEGAVVLAVRENWPRGRDVFCYPLEAWPADARILEEVPVERCWRAGAAVHLMLRRRVHRRSLFVWARGRDGRALIFWRSPSSVRAARPGLRVPHASGLGGGVLAIAVDTRERYAWRFASYPAHLERRELPAGDYGLVWDDRVVAAVERKSPADVAQAAVGGRLTFQLRDLARVPRAVLVVEGRLSDVLKAGTAGGVRSGWLLGLVSALQAAEPHVPWIFAETRALAEAFAYRWLGASLRAEREGAQAALPAAPVPPQPLAEAAASGRRRTAAPDRRDRAPAPGADAHAPPALADSAPRSPAPGPHVLDAKARQALALAEAAAGRVWTPATLAAVCRVSPQTAGADLRILAAAGRLLAEGRTRSLRYRHADAAAAPGPDP